MLKKLRTEFVIITISLVGFVLVVALGSSLISTYRSQRNMVTQSLEAGLETEADDPPRFDESMGSSVVYMTYLVDVKSDGSIVSQSSYPIDESMLYSTVTEALQSDETHGWDRDLHLEWMKQATDDGWRIAIANTTTVDNYLSSLAMFDSIVVVVSLVVLFVIVWFLSAWILKPVQRSWVAQRRFIADASHELKTPLSVIVADLGILLEDTTLTANQHKWVESANNEAQHMRDLVESLLMLERTDEVNDESSDTKLAKKDIDLTDLIDSCAIEFDAIAFERGCSLDTSLEPNVHVEGDEPQLARAIRTLIDNATKYATKGTTVMITLDHDENSRVRIRVNNASEPIDPEDLEHLFDRFYRTDKARGREETGGFGLGLAICKGIVTEHGGTITAASTAEEGTTFTILL